MDGPSVTPEVISVAATNGVTAVDIPLVVNSPDGIAGTYAHTQTLDFAPILTLVTANVVYVGRGCPATQTDPADPYPSGNLSGQIFLIDRGLCNVSLKIDHAARAGTTAALIGLVAPGDAIPFSNGGETQFVPSLVITQSDSNSIKSALASSAVNVTLSPANAIPLAGNVAGYSSRGPNASYNMLKPDISAPLAVSLSFGTYRLNATQTFRKKLVIEITATRLASIKSQTSTAMQRTRAQHLHSPFWHSTITSPALLRI
ncbi:MAG: S8 family serine peptidase [Acidobacteriaceae bacterium]|nr:S8 family serine peptidase [Acidobacteriaceae bacterium]